MPFGLVRGGNDTPKVEYLRKALISRIDRVRKPFKNFRAVQQITHFIKKKKKRPIWEPKSGPNGPHLGDVIPPFDGSREGLFDQDGVQTIAPKTNI